MKNNESEKVLEEKEKSCVRNVNKCLNDFKAERAYKK